MSNFSFTKTKKTISFDNGFSDDDGSVADPNDIAKILKDTEDMDGDLFKNLSKNNGSNNINLSKTMPAMTRNKSFVIDEDPLLTDIDNIIGKNTPSFNKTMSSPSKNTTNFFDDKKPPISTQISMPATKKTIMFDDIDESNLFDSKPVSNSTIKQSPSQTQKSGKSLADDLFSVNKTEESSVNNSFEFKLNDKYINMSQQASKPNTNDNDDFQFGGYVPSSINQPRTNTSSRRNVAFPDDIFSEDIFSTLPTKSSKQQQKQSDSSNNSLLKSMPAALPSNSKSDDWLGTKSVDLKLENNMSKSKDIDFDFSKPLRPPMSKSSSQQKDSSMNSSFAESVPDNNLDIPYKNNLANISVLSGLNNIQPLKFDSNNKENANDGSGTAPSNLNITNETEDGWLNNLISNKKSSTKTQPKPGIVSNNNSSLNITNPIANINSSHIATDQEYSSTLSSNKIVKTSSNSNQEPNELLQKIKQLEYENQDLLFQLQHHKANSDLQIKLIQEGYESRIKMMKEDHENSLNQFKESKQALQNHIDLIEKEKQEMANIYKRKTDDIQNECTMELDKLRHIQRDVIERLKEEHEQALNRVKHLKDTELDAAMAASTHTRTIESVLNLIEDNTKNLNGLSQKVQMGHMINLNEHEIQLKNKEEQLKLQEERLLKQQKEYDNEIRMLNETVRRLENHLAEQTKSVAEERWKGKQHEKKMEAFQEALVNEQRIVMEKLARERNDIERSKDEILNEQKRLMQQIYEEKRKLAEERAKLDSEITAYKDKKHKDSLSNINIEADITVSTRRLNEDKQRIEQLSKELKEKEFELKQESIKLEEKRRELDIKFTKLEQMSFTVNQKYQNAEDLYNKATKEKEDQLKILDQVKNIKSGHESRLNQIQQQLNLSNEREAFINQEKISILKQRQELELFKSNITCTKCKEPVKEFGQQFGVTLPSSGYGTLTQANLLTSSTLRYQSTLNNYSMNSDDLEDAKMLRQLKIQALRDRQFINEEKQFIETLNKNNNSFNNTRSLSMNRLNMIVS